MTALPRSVRPSLLRLPAVLLLALLLSACETPPPRPSFPQIGFSHLPPIRLDVAEIEVVQAYVPPMESPYVGHLFPQPPYEVAERWGRQRLVAVGTERRAVVTVKQGSAIEEALPRTEGLKGIFTTDQAERYTARAVVTVEIVGPSGSLGTVTAEVSRATTVAEDISLSERERTWFELTDKLMTALDQELESGVKTTFFRYLVQ